MYKLFAMLRADAAMRKARRQIIDELDGQIEIQKTMAGRIDDHDARQWYIGRWSGLEMAKIIVYKLLEEKV